MSLQETLSDPRALAESIATRHGEPDRSLHARARALQEYVDSVQPDRVHHLWRYSDPARFTPGEQALDAAAREFGVQGELPAALQERLKRGEIAGLAFASGAGRARVELSSELSASGVRILDLHEALTRFPSVIEGHFARLVGSDVDASGLGKLEALNFGLWSAGTVIYVPRNVQIDKPIHVWLTAPRPARETYLATRLLVVVDEGAAVTIVDESEGGSSQLKLSSVVEIFAGQASRVRYVSVQRLDRGTSYHVTQRAGVARDADLLTAIASLGSGVTKADFGSHLRGPGSRVELFGFLFGEDRQHFDHHTVHAHESGKSYSNLDFKVVLKDRARSAYTGLIRIEPGCPDSEAYQENRNLLLNEGARAESIPELEILTDEVKCTHGATVGTLDAQHVFYLMSRGIDRAEAIRLIVGGFIEPTLSRLDSDLRERLRAHVEDRVRGL